MKSEIKTEDVDAAAMSKTQNSEAMEDFAKRVLLVLHFLHHSSSDIRRTAVHTLDSLLSLRLQKVGILIST